MPVTINGTSTAVIPDASGNVGIGTATPTTKLQIRQTNNTTTGGFSILSTDGTQASVISELDNGSMTFRNAGVDRVSIDSSGNVIVGATASWSGNQQFASETTSKWAVGGYNSGTSGNGVFLARVNNTGVSLMGLYYTSSTQVGSITTNGTGVTYGTASDYRLKENVQPMQNALAKVAQLNPVTYTWKSNGSEGQGFIAHELQSVVPDCVRGKKDEIDNDGKPVYQNVDTSFLVATLTKAIQELKAELDAANARIAALEAK